MSILVYSVDIFVYNEVFGFIYTTNINYLLTGIYFKLTGLMYIFVGSLWAYDPLTNFYLRGGGWIEVNCICIDV